MMPNCPALVHRMLAFVSCHGAWIPPFPERRAATGNVRQRRARALRLDAGVDRAAELGSAPRCARPRLHHVSFASFFSSSGTARPFPVSPAPRRARAPLLLIMESS
jgi:hypothetical protein